MSIIWLLILFGFASCQLNVQIYPLDNIVSTSVNPRACYANCEFCQVSTGQCQQCYSPFYTKDINGFCVLTSDYILESSQNQLRSGNSFIPSTSWSLQTTTVCSQNPTFNLKVVGLFGTQTITYRRTISSHKYFTLKFMLIKVNWTATSTINLTITNQLGVSLYSNNITSTSNVTKCRYKFMIESLCSNGTVDQRFSYKIQFRERSTNEINLILNANMNSSTSFWGISTIGLVTGGCNQNCEDCNKSPAPDQCISCRNFFTLSSNNSCQDCSQGFNLVAVGTQNICRKCGIEFEKCQNSSILCYYRNSLTGINTSCQISQPNNYNDQKLLNDLSFTGSLFTLDNQFISSQCGQYSFVGLGSRRSTITRIFTNVIGHIALSVSFNILVVDQATILDKQPFIALVDNVIIDTFEITLKATSNVCGNYSLLQVFTTFPPTRFISHTSVTNVNISITSNATNWGIRDLRIVYQKCDGNCLTCTDTDGCTTCSQLFQVSEATCTGCTSGYRFNSTTINNITNNSCQKCLDANCDTCITNSATCSQCVVGFYVFQGTCVKHPQFGDVTNGTNDGWQGQPVSPQTGEQQCFIGTSKFLVVQDKLVRKFTVPMSLVNTEVQFRLIKVDNWDQTEFLDVYFNDLRVIHRNFKNTGNKICYSSLENDQVSFEQIQLQDNNTTLTVQFQVVKNLTVKRKFGIADFKIVPFGCQKCSSFGFDFKASYNFGAELNVQVAFNRIYRNDDPNDFKTIFKLMNLNTQIPYSIVRNDSIRYILSATLTKFIIKANLKVICRYPLRVITSVQDRSTPNQLFTVQRSLQQVTPGLSKFIDANQADFTVQRFSPLNDRYDSAQRLRQFFNVMSRIVIYAGFASFFFGCQTPFTHLMHNFQKIWMHIYVATLSLHPLLILALSGFRQIQDQNIAINPSVWESPLPSQLYFDAPSQYQQYFVDISFLRNIYNIAFAFAIFIVFYIFMRIILSFWTTVPSTIQDLRLFKHLRITFVKRPYFYFNSIIFYQYVTLILACCLQFIDLVNRTNVPSFSGANAAACVVAFIFGTIYPICHYIYLKYKKQQLYGAEKYIKYVNRYSQIFYRFLPQNLLKGQNQLISESHLIYNMIRFGEIWWTAIVVSLMYSSPFAQAFLLMILNSCHLLLVLFTDLNYTAVFRWLKAIELIFFVGIEIIMLVLVVQLSTITQQSFLTLAIVAIVFIFIIVTFSIIRTIYTFIKIYREYDNLIESGKSNIDGRIRNFAHYDSLSNAPQVQE